MISICLKKRSLLSNDKLSSGTRTTKIAGGWRLHPAWARSLRAQSLRLSDTVVSSNQHGTSRPGWGCLRGCMRAGRRSGSAGSVREVTDICARFSSMARERLSGRVPQKRDASSVAACPRGTRRPTSPLSQSRTKRHAPYAQWSRVMRRTANQWLRHSLQHNSFCTAPMISSGLRARERLRYRRTTPRARARPHCEASTTSAFPVGTEGQPIGSPPSGEHRYYSIRRARSRSCVRLLTCRDGEPRRVCRRLQTLTTWSHS